MTEKKLASTLQPAAQTQLARNLWAVLGLRAVQRFMLVAPIMVPFFAHYGQDLQAILLLESIYACVVLVMELPSGYLADRLGRVTVLRLGALFWSSSWLLLLGVNDFSGLVLLEIFTGLGSSLLSGADLTLLYDSERALQRGESARSNRTVRNLFVVGMAAEGLAALSATALLMFSGIELVILLQAICGVSVLLASLLLLEPPVRRGQLRSLSDEWEALWQVLSALWQQSTLMRRLLGALCLWPLVNFLTIWLTQAVWVELELTLVHFGWIWCILQVVAALTGQLAHRVETWLGAYGTIQVIGVTALAGITVLAIGQLVWALAGAGLLFAARGVFAVLFMDALNWRIDGDYRATINSLIGFGLRLGFVIAAPIFGLVFDVMGLWATVLSLLLLAVLVFAGLLLPLARQLR